MRLEIERKSFPEGDKTNLELASYMTLANIRNSHKFLILKSAMKANYTAENFITAAHFCKQILDLEDSGVSPISHFRYLNPNLR